jgi:F-type H+-transporting ATPase subunit gamma
MRRAINIASDLTQIHTVEDLTEVFESIASIRISKIRDRVVDSKAFFAELWQTYSGLRIDPSQRMNAGKDRAQKGKNVFVVVTSEGNLNGEIDEEIVTAMLADYGKMAPDSTDVVVLGSHGQSQLRQRTIPIAKSFSMPSSDVSFSVSDIIATLGQYDHISVFYQTYESLRVQKVARIELLAAVKNLGDDVEGGGEVVSSRDYIFEPSVDEIADYLESVMMGVALIQVIMESKLAQYAARFNAMNSAKHRASELVSDYNLQYHRAKRAESDERLKEIIKIVRHHQKGVA